MHVPQITAGAQSQADLHGGLMDTARLAYIYGFPTYEVARLRYRALSLARKGKLLRLNTFLHSRTLSTPTTALVTAVNSDTLLSRAWIDLSRGPLVIHVPDVADRYYSLALMDFFTNNFAVLGQRPAGTAAGNFLLAGPRWDGTAPAALTLIRAPTNAVWALARILIYGPDDVATVRALQDQLTISRSGVTPDSGPPSRDPLSLPVAALETTDLLTFFDVLNAALTENPPPASDKVVLDRLQSINVGPSLQFSRGDFSKPQLNALRQGLASARDTISAHVGFRTPTQQKTRPRQWPSDALLARLRGPPDASRAAQFDRGRSVGWSGPTGQVGNFGTDYLTRAQCALAGLGLLPREEAMYFSTATDAIGAALHGDSRYILAFPPGGLPPVDAFWSLTVYQTDANQRRWLVANPINRYSIGNRTPGLCYGGDSSLEILIQRDRPASGEENWLPAPAGPFLLTLRAYLPRPELRDGAYRIPAVRRLR
jgi:hypothetical protein